MMETKGFRDPDHPLEPNVVRSASEPSTAGSSAGMILGGLAALALIFGLAFYFNGDGDGGRNIATSKNPGGGISQPATTGSGASTTGSGAVGR
jgi:hypothetical protein